MQIAIEHIVCEDAWNILAKRVKEFCIGFVFFPDSQPKRNKISQWSSDNSDASWRRIFEIYSDHVVSYWNSDWCHLNGSRGRGLNRYMLRKFKWVPLRLQRFLVDSYIWDENMCSHFFSMHSLPLYFIAAAVICLFMLTSMFRAYWLLKLARWPGSWA